MFQPPPTNWERSLSQVGISELKMGLIWDGAKSNVRGFSKNGPAGAQMMICIIINFIGEENHIFDPCKSSNRTQVISRQR